MDLDGCPENPINRIQVGLHGSKNLFGSIQVLNRVVYQVEIIWLTRVRVNPIDPNKYFF